MQQARQGRPITVGELGTRLREARESRGISFEQAEKETRHPSRVFAGPGRRALRCSSRRVYARGFIRNYARYLGLDAEELLTLYKKAVGASVASIPQVLNEPLSPRDGPSIGSGILIGAMVVIIIALAGWYIYHRFYLGVEPWPLTLLKAPPATVASSTALSLRRRPKPPRRPLRKRLWSSNPR
jgi:cytoskeletal protein RodZ